MEGGKEDDVEEREDDKEAPSAGSETRVVVKAIGGPVRKRPNRGGRRR